MPRPLLIAYLLFLIGIGFKIFWLPFASLLLVLGTTISLVYSLIYWIKNFKTNVLHGLFYVAVAVNLLYVTFRVQYWPIGRNSFGLSYVFIFVISASLAYILVFFIKKQRVNTRFVVLLSLFIGTFYLTAVPAHQVHSTLYLNNLTYDESRKTNFIQWDYYSWFLYVSDAFDEALDANQKAQQALKKVLEKDSSELLLQNQRQLEEVENMIRTRSWKRHHGLRLEDYN
jgi:hypothetical protein